MTLTTLNLRERALLSFESKQVAARDTKANRRALHIEQMEQQLRTELNVRLGLDITPDHYLHTISDGGVPTPAYKDPDTDLMFALKHVLWEGYRLHLVRWCQACQLHSWHQIRSLEGLGEVLRDPVQCYQCWTGWA